MSTDLERDGIAPTAELTPAIDVRIARPQAPHRSFHDDGTVLAFLDWQLETSTFPLSGTGSSGPGFYHGTFAAADAPAIEAWLRDRGLA